MPRKVLTYLRQNLLALLALFVALGGTSYAALNIDGSQIRNHTIDAVKLNPKSISASIRAWATVSGHGTVEGSSSRVRVRTYSTGEAITWIHQRFGRSCIPSVTALSETSTGGYGVATALFDPPRATLTLSGFGPNYAPEAPSAYVMIVCP